MKEDMETKIERGYMAMNEAFELMVNTIDGQINQLNHDQHSRIFLDIQNMFHSALNLNYAKVYAQFYESFGEKLKSYCDDWVMPSLENKHGLVLVNHLWKCWSDYQLLLQRLSNLFHHMGSYLEKHSLESIKEVGIRIFSEKVYQRFKCKFTNAILDMIHREREGEWINESVVNVRADLFASVTEGELQEAYENDFERELLARTVTYYAGKAEKISTTSLADYMIMVEDCLKLESYIANRHFPPSTEPKLLEIMREQFLSLHLEQLVENEQSGIHLLLADGRMEDVSRMFALFSKIDKGLDSICDKFLKCIIDNGMGLIKHAEDKSSQKKDKRDVVGQQEYDFVGRLIELHVKYMNYVENCFESHSIFRKALRDAFELLCNKTVAGNSISEIVCFYIDNILKKGGGKSEKLKEPIEETFDKIIGLLNYVQGKDLFAEFYRNKLASRLLNGSSTSDDNERSLLTKIKLQFGMQLISKMEGMIADMTLAREKQTEFGNYLEAFPQEHPGVDLTVTVLTTGFWPTYDISYPEIPQEMGSCIEAYKSFYTCETRKRTVTWLFSQGTCIMTGKFDARPIEMSLTTYQAVLLLLFNDCDRLSFQEIASQLKLPNDKVLRLLHSLSCSKYKILNKEPNNKIISVRDVFEFNSKFTDKMRKIKIPPPPLCEKKKVIEEVNKDRRYEIDAAIVRIMKSRKVLAYQLLISECIQQLSTRFVPDVKVIKKRIEELITRDFLERDTTNSDAFRYLP